MYSYIIKLNSKRVPTLIKRRDGNRISHTYIPQPMLASLYSRAIIHENYAILHYADTENTQLDNLLKGTA
jgi:hypothetical protein